MDPCLHDGGGPGARALGHVPGLPAAADPNLPDTQQRAGQADISGAQKHPQAPATQGEYSNISFMLLIIWDYSIRAEHTNHEILMVIHNLQKNFGCLSLSFTQDI